MQGEIDWEGDPSIGGNRFYYLCFCPYGSCMYIVLKNKKYEYIDSWNVKEERRRKKKKGEKGK